MKIQMSAIKTGLSVFTAILIANILKLEFPFFVALAVIMPIEDSFSSALKSGKYRMAGTIIGAVIGVLLVIISPFNPVLCGIGIIAMIYFGNLLKLGDSAVPIGGIVFISIMVNLKGKNPVGYSLNRILDTLIGVLIVIIVNYIIPSYNRKKIYTQISDMKGELLYYINEVVCLKNNINLAKLYKRIIDMDDRLNKSTESIFAKTKYENSYKCAKTLLGLYKNTYEYLRSIILLEKTCVLEKNNYEKLKLIYNDDSIPDGEYQSNQINIVFNYNVSKIVDNINNINNNIVSLGSGGGDTK